MTEKEYNQAEGIRRSLLWKLKKSPAHMKYEMEHPAEPTAALIFGAAAHCAILTPELFGEQYAVIDADLRTKEGRMMKAQAMESGKITLTRDDMDRIAGMKDAVMANRYAKRLLDGPKETPYFWTDDITGEACKCRTDAETEVGEGWYIVDLKTCGDASNDGFMRDALKYGYHVQAAMYREGVQAVTGKECAFVFLCVEKEPPYAVNILQCDDAFILHGTDEYRYLLGLYHECRVRDMWPGYGGFENEINALELPAWLRKAVE